MKRTIQFIILSFLTMASTAQSADEAAIRKILAEQVLAWNKGNIDEFMNAYWQNDSLTFISRDGITRGYNATLSRYRKNYDDTAKMGKLFFELISVKKLSPEYYFVTGKWSLKRSIGDIGGLYTLLFKKIKSKWVIVTDHTS